MVNKFGQMKIQQMAFMIVAIFFFFILVALFLINIQFKDIGDRYSQLQKERAISSLSVISDIPELSCDSMESFCLDEDKLRIMSGKFGEEYNEFWAVSSIKVYKVYSLFGSLNKSLKECPGLNCNYYEIFDNKQKNVKEYSTFVSICSKMREEGYIYDRCEVGKLVVGVKIYEK